MFKNVFLLALLGVWAVACAGEYSELEYGELLPGSGERVGLWWASSGWKIGRDRPLPRAKGQMVVIRAARNEVEAAQLVVRPTIILRGLTVRAGALSGPTGAVIPAECVEILRVGYVEVTLPTDKSSTPGFWPDPLPPLKSAIDLAPNRNQPLWVRVKVPQETSAGVYTGKLALAAQEYDADVTLTVEVYDFTLPDRMTCTTAFGFSAGTVFRYQHLSTEQERRSVLDKYWASFAAHHVSPYDPAPLDGMRVKWPDIKPPVSHKYDNWEGIRLVDNETHSGTGALLIHDEDATSNVTVSYSKPIEIPAAGLLARFWYRTAVPDHRFCVSLNHYDRDGKWMSGRNNDMTLKGTGRWQLFEAVVADFPQGAKFVRPMLRATLWTDAGELTGLVWFDDLRLCDAASGENLIEGGDFDIEKRTEPVALPEKLKAQIDFGAWDKAMERGINHYKFNSFRLAIPGIGGGTFHALSEPSLLGFAEDEPEYPVLLESYCSQLEAHLAQKGWLGEAYIYWFDEPSPDQYEFVMNGFEKLKRYCPRIPRMLTEQPEPQLEGGPNIYCVISNLYRHEAAERRRAFGDKFWWYVCTGPKAPYCTLFIDHPATELRVWLWQTWQRKIDGILVWATNYWTSSAAYPDPEHPQNPYQDPMGWRSGYSTPKGEKRPWGNGDGRFIYPPEIAGDAHPPEPVLDGPVDSIRWEMLRDGIEDYEYLAILDRLLRAKQGRLTQIQQRRYAELLAVPEDITKDMTTFTRDPGPVEARRDSVAKAVAQLGKL